MNQYKVCVVDSCLESANVLTKGLVQHSYEVVTASNGAEALQVCSGGGVDLLLVDLTLPDTSGYDVCRQVKDDSATRDVVVLFTSEGDPVEDVQAGYQLGAVGFLRKPYNLPIVMVNVDAALRRKQMRGQFSAPEHLLLDGAYTDHLTGLRNSRYLMERFQEELEKSKRYRFPVSCVLFDLDHIEAQDDELGPASLDDLLAEVAMALRTHTRGYDILARYDGTMFAGILPHTPLNDAVQYARKIQADVDATTFSDPSSPTGAGLSAGVVSYPGGGSGADADYVLGETMQVLLRAKSLHGNRLAAQTLSTFE